MECPDCKIEMRCREIKWFFQRAIRGYSEQDVWNLYSYLQSWLPKALRDLSEMTNGCPGGFGSHKVDDTGQLSDNQLEENFKEWKSLLLEMADKIEASELFEMSDEHPDIKTQWEEYKKARGDAYQRTEEGLTMLAKHFHSLWD